VGLIFMGIASAFSPIILVKALKVKMTLGLMKQIMFVGIGMIVAGIAGVVLKAKMS
jgi:hypothetical protein